MSPSAFSSPVMPHGHQGSQCRHQIALFKLHYSSISFIFSLFDLQSASLRPSDDLLTTDFSTFGYTAAGLSGITPLSMNIVVNWGTDWRTNGRPVCERLSPEPCTHKFPTNNGTFGVSFTLPELGSLRPSDQDL